MPRKLHLAISSSNYSKSKIRKNLEKCQKGKNTLHAEEQRVRVTLNFSSGTLQARRE